MLGGLGGLLVGLGLLAIPGIGPVLAAGPIVTTLAGAGVGAAAGGLVGALVNAGIPSEQAEMYVEGVKQGGTLVTVTTSDDRAGRAVDIMNRYNPIDMENRRSGKGATGQETRDMRREDQSTSVPIIEEELRVGKREVETGGVRIHTYVEENPVEESVNLRDERVEVERRPVDREVSPEDIDAFKEGTIEMTEKREEVVTDKTAHVVEEVEIHKDVDERTETVRDTVRRTDVEVENVGRGQSTGTTDFAGYDDQFRRHFTTTYSGTDYSYDDYRPYYEYGYRIAGEDRFRNRDWNDVEMDARREFERSHSGGVWEDVKDAIRAGWETVTGRR
ncbi:MAG: DUF2382 domain-containing protein [Chloroflexota bacterium]|nr:MAG: DUF2382 domain-containing protein [Chloroflexota bacterium]